MLIAASAFILGILTAFYWPAPTLILCLVLFAAALYKQSISMLLLALVCLLLGFCWADWHLQSYQAALVPAEIEGQDIVLQARISAIPVRRHTGWRLVVEVQNSQPATPIRYLQLNWYQDNVTPKLGEHWAFTARLKRPHGYANPAGFNFEKWMLSRGLHGRGYIRHADRLHSPTQPALRQTLWDSLQRYPGAAGSLIGALVLGEKHGLSHAQRQLFVDTGTAHLFAISGLHIGMVAGLLFLCSKLLMLLILYLPKIPILQNLQRLIYRITPLRIALLSSWLGCSAYAVLAGFSLSTQRALIMLTVAYLACALRQRIFSIHSFALALLLILIAQPAAVLGIGLFLSFGAVAWIAYLFHMLPMQQASWKKVLFIQLLLPLCLWPILQFYFASSASLGALANLVLIPLMSFVLLPLCLLATLLEAWQPLANGGLIEIINHIYHYSLVFLQQLTSYSWAKPVAWPMNLPQLVLLQLAMALLLLPQGFPKALKALALLAAVFVFMPNKPAFKAGEFQASVLDVGQGLAVLIQTKSHNLLFDTGPQYPSGFSASQAVILPYLHSHRVRQLDHLILSHGDQDHQGGLTPLLKNIHVQRTTGGQPQRAPKGITLQQCHAGQAWQWDGVAFNVLWPPRDIAAAARANNHSCVLHISSATQSILLTGDIEQAVEAKLLSDQVALQAAVLVAPHHGSNSSSSSAFIQAVNPQQVVFSAAYRSRFGHPHTKVLQRYSDAGVKRYLTAYCGRFLYTQSGVSCQRSQHKQRWQVEMLNK